MSRGIRKLANKNSPYFSSVFAAATITVGAETGGTTRNVGIQLEDGNGNAIEQAAHVDAYISSSADGMGAPPTAPTTAVAIGTDGLLLSQVADKAFTLVSEEDGSIDINITDSGTWTGYLVLRMPDGSLVISDVIAIT